MQFASQHQANTANNNKQHARVRFIFECVLGACGSPQ